MIIVNWWGRDWLWNSRKPFQQIKSRLLWKGCLWIRVSVIHGRQYSTFLGSEFGNEERESRKSPCSAFDQIGRELGAPWSASVSFIANCLPISQAAWLQHFLIAPKCFWVWTLVVAWLPLGSLFSGGERSVAWWSLVSLERPGCSQGISAQTGFLSKHLCGQAFQLILNRFPGLITGALRNAPHPPCFSYIVVSRSLCDDVDYEWSSLRQRRKMQWIHAK